MTLTQQKKHKKGGDQEGPGDHKGKTLAEIEQEEGGPVKESLIGMAQVKRAENRKKDGTQGMEDTDIPTDVNKFEEDAEVLHSQNKFYSDNTCLSLHLMHRRAVCVQWIFGKPSH